MWSAMYKCLKDFKIKEEKSLNPVSIYKGSLWLYCKDEKNDYVVVRNYIDQELHIPREQFINLFEVVR